MVNKPKVGIIGKGMVGGAIAEVSQDKCELHFYDKYKGIGSINDIIGNNLDLIFVCVPTPTVDNHQDLSAIEDVLNKLNGHVSCPVVVKSTVLPGWMDIFQLNYPLLNLAHNPEFLTERNAVADFLNQPWVLISCMEDMEAKIKEVYSVILPGVEIKFSWDYRTTEMAKYIHNTFLATKVAYFNQIYDFCEEYDINYDEAVAFASSQGKIGDSHMRVPGVDGKRGYGGACLVGGTNISIPGSAHKKIENIQIGDVVDSFEGATIVKNVGKRFVDSTIKIKSRGRILIGSHDHIQLIYDEGSDSFKEVLFKDITINDWLPMCSGKYVVENYQFNIGNKPNNYIRWWPNGMVWSSELAYAIGLWLADGCYNEKEYRVSWSCGLSKKLATDKLEKCLSILGLNPCTSYKESQGTYGLSRLNVTRISSFGFLELLRYLGCLGDSHTKKCPLVPNEFASDLLAGWLDGDGCSNEGTISGYSESVDLIYGIDVLLLSMSINAAISKKGRNINISLRNDAKKISKNTTRHGISEDRYVRDVEYESPTMKNTKFGWVTKVRSIEINGPSLVYSIETESGMYIANNILTHNCFPKDTQAIFKDNEGILTILGQAMIYNSRIRKD